MKREEIVDDGVERGAWVAQRLDEKNHDKFVSKVAVLARESIGEVQIPSVGLCCWEL